jgi:hypothetical protein
MENIYMLLTSIRGAPLPKKALIFCRKRVIKYKFWDALQPQEEENDEQPEKEEWEPPP